MLRAVLKYRRTVYNVIHHHGALSIKFCIWEGFVNSKDTRAMQGVAAAGF